MKVGDLVKNIHALDFDGLGIIIEVSKPQLSKTNGCPYKVHWLGNAAWLSSARVDCTWNSSKWLEKISETV